MSADRLNLLNFSLPRIRLLHLSWVAFFISFALWFSHAPLMGHLRDIFDLTGEQVKALLILNVALTIPARVVIGSLVDRFGPRRVFSTLLMSAALPCWAFALSNSFEQLAISRLLLGFVGASFVVGIRLISEWFPAREVGLAEGIYAGWGNFGAFASYVTLPTLALFFGGEDGWRWAVASTGFISFLYGLFFMWRARNTPAGASYFKPKKASALEVSNRRDLFFYIGASLPLYIALYIIVWRLGPAGFRLYDNSTQAIFIVAVSLLAAIQLSQIWQVNRERWQQSAPEQDSYPFKQVAILNLSYFITFGSELAVNSMLPLFFLDTFSEVTPVTAGLLASAFAFTNLVARPGGGWLSDRIGRKKSLTILFCGLLMGFVLLSQINSGWPVLLAMAATMVCSCFIQGGGGAIFATVPLIKRRLTGQISGMVGAYGNAGAVVFLTALTFVDASTFFLVIAACATAVLVAVQFLDEPKGHIAEVDEDGRVQLIEVS